MEGENEIFTLIGRLRPILTLILELVPNGTALCS